MNKILTFITGERFMGIVSLVAAGVMYFTPDHIDNVIEGFLVLIGAPKLIVRKKD